MVMPSVHGLGRHLEASQVEVACPRVASLPRSADGLRHWLGRGQLGSWARGCRGAPLLLAGRRRRRLRRLWQGCAPPGAPLAALRTR
eukprot:scaffold24947_cov73-Phaeocystis_antarctica.AAC.4